MFIPVPKWKILVRSLWSFADNDLVTSSAAIAYFSMIALFPTLLLVLAVGNSILGPEAVEKYVVGQVLAFFPGAQQFVRANLQSIYHISTEVILSCLFVMLWAASWVFTVIEKALNRIYATPPRSFVHGRVMNFAVLSLVWVSMGVLGLSTAFLSLLRAAAQQLPWRFGAHFTDFFGYAWQAVFILASAIVTIALFTLLYRLLPNIAVPFSEALAGGCVAGALWETAKFGFAYLLPYFHYDMLYGSIGAGVALLVWVYVSSMILLFGAQFTALLHREHLYEASATGSLRARPATADLETEPEG